MESYELQRLDSRVKALEDHKNGNAGFGCFMFLLMLAFGITCYWLANYTIPDACRIGSKRLEFPSNPFKPARSFTVLDYKKNFVLLVDADGKCESWRDHDFWLRTEPRGKDITPVHSP